MRVVVDGTGYKVHRDGRVYEANPRGDRRIKDPHMVARVYEAFGAELKRRAVNRARF